MSWIEDERRHRIDLAQRKPKASEAIEVLKGLGWTSQTFADIAYALGKEERGDVKKSSYPPLRTSKTKQENERC